MNPWDLHELASRLKKKQTKTRKKNEQNVIILARFSSEIAFKFLFM